MPSVFGSNAAIERAVGRADGRDVVPGHAVDAVELTAEVERAAHDDHVIDELAPTSATKVGSTVPVVRSTLATGCGAPR